LDELASAVQRAIWTSAKGLELQVHAMNVQPDHVHFACSSPPKHAPSELARQLKGSSSHFLGREFEGFWPGWQTEYGIVGFGGQSLSRVVAYVNNQDEHHRENRLWLELEKGLDEPLPSGRTLGPSPIGTSDV
jgi:REP element-mobilizing transposase RayT